MFFSSSRHVGTFLFIECLHGQIYNIIVKLSIDHKVFFFLSFMLLNVIHNYFVPVYK